MADESCARLLFLVGGPGAGKSHAAAAAVLGLTEIDPSDDGLAHRRYRYKSDPRDLLVVNDATITDPLHVKNGLARDIGDVIDEGLNLIACVNRGVLVEELSALGSMDEEPSPESAILRWLHGGPTSGPDHDRAEWGVETDTSSAYLRSGRLLEGTSLIAQILIVYVDVCSLLERTPKVSVTQVGLESSELVASDYRVLKYQDRQSVPDSEFPAGKLLESVVSILGGIENAEPNTQFNPILANLQSLSVPAVRNGVLSIFRASEIVSSQRMTYREIWGAIARCVAGDAPSRTSSTLVREFLAGLEPKSSDPLFRFQEMQELASLRFSQAVFGAQIGHVGVDQLVRNPVTRLTHSVDPVRDALPGVNTKGSRGWANPVVDAFANQIGDGSPLRTLGENLLKDDPFHLAITYFEEELDSTFARAMSTPTLKEPKRYELIGWYGAYLTRLYAIANGIPAFRAEIEAWTTAWVLSPKIPDVLETQLLTLLKPDRIYGIPASGSLIPILESRTNPIIGASRPMLAMRTSGIEVRTGRDSDALFLRVKEGEKELRPIVLDFPLIREAMACGEGHPGVTELSEAASPRLERFRAARLVPGKYLEPQRYRIVAGVGDEVLSVGES